MTLISIRLPENILKEADQKARALHLNRTEYIRRAVEQLNQALLEGMEADNIESPEPAWGPIELKSDLGIQLFAPDAEA
ncbi:MAG: ribbon-helix-helix domain-containing protein [Gammaproteobacteria bacterium]